MFISLNQHFPQSFIPPFFWVMLTPINLNTKSFTALHAKFAMMILDLLHLILTLILELLFIT